ncbi:hypothetical protein C8F01DRAFT_1260311 [Mycena amicta]|nr:hypothetical protein C8F01DRAFT_1260311 [Mycena amicta]
MAAERSLSLAIYITVSLSLLNIMSSLKRKASVEEIPDEDGSPQDSLPHDYPYAIEPATALWAEDNFPLVAVNLPGRDPLLPKIYTVAAHPQAAQLSGTAYVYFQDTTQAGLQATWDHESQLETPSGAPTSGLLELCPGDSLFVRSRQGTRLVKDDIPVAWVVGRDIITPDMLKRFRAARATFLGPPSARTSQRPTNEMVDGETKLVGGIAYERTAIAKPVKDGGRSYTLGPSYEGPTKMVAPVASFKVGDPDAEAAANVKQEFVSITTEIGIKAIEKGPPTFVHRLKDAGSLHNVPSYGVDGNYAFGTSQVNVAAAQNAANTNSLAADLGFFGSAHEDKNDSAGHMTHMLCYSDIPNNYKPGVFYIHGAGVHVVTSELTSIIFSGLRRHGGTPPLAPTGVTVDPAAVRLTIIDYPPNAIMNGLGRLRLAAWPNGEPLYIPPEVINAGISYYNQHGVPKQADTSRTTFSREGLYIMSALSILTFLIRSLMLLVNYFLEQLPADYNIEFYPELFERSISFQLGDGARRSVDHWEYAPGYRNVDDQFGTFSVVDDTERAKMVDQDEKRSAAAQEWEEHKSRIWAITPSLGSCGSMPSQASKLNPGPKRQPRKAKAGKGSKAKASRARRPQRKSTKKARPTPPASKTKKRLSKTKKRRPKARAFPTTEDWQTDEEEVEDEVPCEVDFVLQIAYGIRIQTLAKVNLVPQNVVGLLIEIHYGRPTHTSMFPRLLTTHPKLYYPDTRYDLVDNNIPFLSTLTLDAIRHDVNDAQRALDATAHSQTDIPSPFLRITDVLTIVGKSPESLSTASAIENIWVAMGQLENFMALESLKATLDRERIMTANFVAWDWLYGYCRGRILTWMDNSQDDNSQDDVWFLRLAAKVKMLLENVTETATLSASTYGLEVTERPFIYSNKKRKHYLPGDELIAYWTTRIVTCWFNYPTASPASRFQAAFILSILNTLGNDALLLRAVWEGYRRVQASVLGVSRGKDHAHERFQLLEAQLKLHPLADPLSVERAAMNRVAQIIAFIRFPNETSPPSPMVLDDDANHHEKCQILVGSSRRDEA